MSDLADLLEPHALRILGETADPDTGGAIVLIGPDEPRFWVIFSDSAEFRDGMADPLDRWSRRVIDGIAADLDADALYPFGGPPWHPFYTWALGTGRCWPSPIGFLVHDQAGLFVSFRGALRLSRPALSRPATKPCESCAAPCATACPVNAFADGYDVAACKAHVQSPAGQSCRIEGCLARRACPVGHGRRTPAQSAFHMEAFL